MAGTDPNRESTMRFMLLMIPNVYRGGKTDPNFRPDPEAVATMGRFNQELSKAGILLALDGLHPPVSGARVGFTAGKAKVLDGPFAEAKEAIGGYFLLKVNSLDEAVAIAKDCPGLPHGAKVEVRPVMEQCSLSGEAVPEVQLAEATA